VVATLLAGLSLGAVYALVAIGYNLTWLTTKAVNFAQGAFMVTGMFLTVFLYDRGVPAPVAIVLLGAIGVVVAAVEYFLAVRPVLGRGEHSELVTTLGAATILQGIILVLVADDVQRVPFFGSTELIDVPGGRVSPAELVLIVLAAVIGVAAHIWTRRSLAGLAAMGLSEDRDAAMLLGVNTARFSLLTFMASGLLGFAIAPFVGPKTFAVVGLALLFAIKGFVALALGGLGSQIGALIAGMSIGVLEAFIGRYMGAQWQNTSVFLVFVLMLRPRGLFGQKRERVV
jgi:branched-chain amino acid transport system permease protein